MESNKKQLSIANTQSSFINEDPNQTISDDEDDCLIQLQSFNDDKQAKKHGRWTKQEQIIFLKYIAQSEWIKSLIKYLPYRSSTQIKIHSHKFIKMCKKEFEVSKAKQQNKAILSRICRTYGFQPSENYLSQLEVFILNSPYTSNVTKDKQYQSASDLIKKTKRKKKKQTIFSIQKTQRKTKVINIVTINVLAGHHSLNEQLNTINRNMNINSKSIVQNPFNINFDNEILNSPCKDNIFDHEIGINKDHTYYRSDIVNEIIESINECNDFNSSVIDF